MYPLLFFSETCTGKKYIQKTWLLICYRLESKRKNNTKTRCNEVFRY